MEQLRQPFHHGSAMGQLRNEVIRRRASGQLLTIRSASKTLRPVTTQITTILQDEMANPSWSSYSTVITPLFRAYRRSEDQCSFGAASVKPTVLRAMGTPKAQFDLEAYHPWRCQADSYYMLQYESPDERILHPAGLSPAIAQTTRAEFHRKVTSGHVHFWGATTNAAKVEWLQAMHVYRAKIRADAIRLPD